MCVSGICLPFVCSLVTVTKIKTKIVEPSNFSHELRNRFIGTNEAGNQGKEGKKKKMLISDMKSTLA